MSFKFYDPIILIVQDQISEDRREFFYSKNKLNFKNHLDSNMRKQMYDTLIYSEDNKLTFKYKQINQRESTTIDHNQSEHTLTLQKSRYIMIDDDYS